jgi:hypothetical protein
VGARAQDHFEPAFVGHSKEAPHVEPRVVLSEIKTPGFALVLAPRDVHIDESEANGDECVKTGGPI